MSKVQVKKSELISMLDNGMTREEIAEKLGLNMNQLKNLLKIAGLEGKRTKKVDFIFVDDSTAVPQELPAENTPERALIDIEQLANTPEQL